MCGIDLCMPRVLSTIFRARVAKLIVLIVGLGGAIWWYKIKTLNPYDRVIENLIHSIKDRPNLFHAQFSESGEKLVNIGMPALSQVLDAVVDGDDETRWRAAMVAHLILRDHFLERNKERGNAALGYDEWHAFLKENGLNPEADMFDRYKTVLKIKMWVRQNT